MEILNPPQYLEEIGERIKKIKAIVSNLEKNPPEKPAENIRVVKNHGCVQFFITERGKTNGRYVLQKEAGKIKEKLQQAYDYKLLKTAKKELKLMERFYLQQKKMNVSTLCKGYSKQRENLISPVTLSDENYAAKWLSINYTGKAFDETSPALFTSKGLRVRSKSEVIIAETLDRLNIPFKYECPLKVGRVTLYPDFLCLNTRTRKEIVWEHFGMMDNSEYVNSAVEKMNLYQKSGYFSGKKLITTWETVQKPLSSQVVAEIAKNYLK